MYLTFQLKIVSEKNNKIHIKEMQVKNYNSTAQIIKNISQYQSSSKQSYNKKWTFYSYVYPTNTNSLQPQKIRLSSRKLMQGINHILNKQKRENIKLQISFIDKINTDKKRDKFNENILIDHMILEAIKFGVYEQLLYSTKRIEQEADLISKGMNKVSEDCVKAIFAIVELYKDFGLDQFIDLKEFLPEPYPTIGIDKLDPNIKRFLKYKKPTQHQRNLFVVEMCKRHQGKISIFKLNEANHGFSQYPEVNCQQEDQLNSDGLYARSASYQVENEQENHEKQMEQFAL